MTTKLAEYCRKHRFARGLTLGDLARQIGALNVSKMANKLVRFEREGIIDPGLLNAVVTALRLYPAVVKTLMAEDEAESLRRWNEWANEPIRPYLLEKPLLVNTTQDQAHAVTHSRTGNRGHLASRRPQVASPWGLHAHRIAR
jgi:hypothetical protein